MCNGTCPPTQVCTPTGSSGCVCKTPCEISGSTGCNGTCPNANQVCAPTAGGGCVCEVPCENSGATGCNGTCPNANQVCAPTAGGGCVCETPCEDSAPMCNGECPGGPSCVALDDGACVC